MRLTISIEEGSAASLESNIMSVDFPGSLSLEDLKAYLQAETNIEPLKQQIRLNGKLLEGDTATLEELGMSEDELLVLSTPREASVGSSSGSVAPSANNQVDNQIEMARQHFLNDPTLNSQLRGSNPDVHATLQNPAEFKQKMLEKMHSLQQNGGGGLQLNQQQQEDLRKLQDNPDDPESQAKILELIRQEQIEENYRLAYDITPESFASVNMLYVNIKVNGHKVQAFVDSGAQTTIITPRLAETLGISRLIDKRFSGQARGVGSQAIEGKIHSVPIHIGDSEIEIPCSFNVIDTPVDLLFGLDMLRRHKCVIDLVEDELVVGGHIKTKFLAESEIENKAFGSGGGPELGSAGPGNTLGTNIVSDVPASSNSLKKSSPASGAAAIAASKRQNTGASNAGASASAAYVPNETDLKHLTDLGFTRSEAIEALKQSNGNVEIAASLLFQ